MPWLLVASCRKSAATHSGHSIKVRAYEGHGFDGTPVAGTAAASSAQLVRRERWRWSSGIAARCCGPSPGLNPHLHQQNHPSIGWAAREAHLCATSVVGSLRVLQGRACPLKVRWVQGGSATGSNSMWVEHNSRKMISFAAKTLQKCAPSRSPSRTLPGRVAPGCPMPTGHRLPGA